MRRHNMALYSSWSKISWESESILFEQQTTKIESRFDIRCNQEFLNMRKRKLLEKLVETRATYESVKNQILANIANNADDKGHNPDTEGMDDAGTGTNFVKQIVDLIDTGYVRSSSVISMESCIGHHKHSRRETCRYKVTSSNSENNQSERTTNNHKKRVVNSKAKRISYGPSSKTTLKPANENIHANDLADNDIKAKYSVSILNRYIYMNYEDSFVTSMVGSTTFMNVTNDANLDTTLKIKQNQIKKRSQRKLDVHMPQQICTKANLDAVSEYYCSRHRLRNCGSKTLTKNTPSRICYDLQNVGLNIEKSHSEFEFIDGLDDDSKHMHIALSRKKNKPGLKDCSSIEFSTKDLNMHILCMLKLQSQNKLPHHILSSISTNSVLSRKLSDLIKQVQSKSLYDMFLKTKCVKIDSSVEPVHQSVSMLSMIAIGPKYEQTNRVVHKLKQATFLKTPHTAQSIIARKSNPIEIEQAKIKNRKCSRLPSANYENSRNKNDLVHKTTYVTRTMYNNHVFKHKISSPSKLHFNKCLSKSPGNVKGCFNPSSFKLREIAEICRMPNCSRSVWENKSFIDFDTNSRYAADTQYVDNCTSQTNNYYTHDYDVCYNFLYGSNYTGTCKSRHQIEVSRKKNNDLNIFYPKPDKGEHQISPNLLNNCYYALNLQSIANTPYKLKDYECEPGVCIPYECDPLECDKRIKRRLTKHKTVQSSQSSDSKSISTGHPRLEGRANKSQAYQGKNRPSRQDRTRKFAKCKSISGRSCVRFGSDLSLNVEFYKDRLSASEGSSKPTRKSHIPSMKGTMSKEIKKIHKDTGMQRKGYDRELQVETHTASKGTGGVGKLLQRCFCTRQLHKRNNITKPIKRGSNAASQCSISPKKKKHEEFKANKEDTASVGTITKHKFKAEPMDKLEPGECEPGICVPNECDPIECEKRIKRRLNTHKTVQSSPSSDDKSINTCSIKSSACAQKSQAHFKTRSHPTRPSKACKPRCPRKITECENVPRKSFRFGSNISLNVDFYMEHPTINANLSRQQKRRVTKTKSTAHKEKKKVNRNSAMSSAGRHRESQVEVQTASKGTGGFGKLLQRCFCTRQLHKQSDVTKPIQRGNNAASQCSISPKKKKHKEFKAHKKDTTSVGTITKHKFKTEPMYRLESGECEPGVCVPHECDPIECEKRMKRRLNTHKTVQSSPSSDVKSINTCSTMTCARITQAHLQTQSHPRSRSKKCKPKCPRNNTECENVPRKSFRFGSDISLDVEFFMEHPSISADVSNQRKGTTVKQHKKVHRDSTMKSKTRHRESQIETETATKGTGVGQFIQRCFCTLKLRKQSKEINQERGKNVKSRGSNTQNRYKRSYLKEAKKDTCGDDCKSVGTITKRKYKPELKFKLEPGECEPGVCIPNECDPYKCLERMKHQFKDSKMTCTDKPVSKSTFTTQTRSVPDAKSTYTEEHKIKVKKGTMSKSRGRAYDSAHPSRQSVHLGSNFSFGIDFYKETAAIGDQPSKAYNKTGKSCDRIQCKKTKKAKSSGTSRINTQHSESQAVVDNRNKASGMGKIMRRCFCTLKLQKSEPNPSLKQKQIKPVVKREQPPKTMISEGTRTPNKVRFQGPVVTRKLEPYECEPNICVPGQCDPYECDKLIKRRNKQTKSSATDFEKSKKCSYCNTTSSKLDAKKIQSDKSTKNSRKRKDSLSPESGTSVVRYGSSIRINFEFYKENGYPQSFAELKKHHRPSEAASEMSQKKKEYQKRHIRMRNKSSGGTECGVKCNKTSQAQPPRRDTQTSAISMLQRCFCTLRLKKKNAQQTKSKPSIKARKHKSMEENVCNMETIMPYSKKKFKKYTSETKLHQHDRIKPSSNRELHNNVSETALGSKSRAVGDLIRKCTCLIREKYRSSRFKRKQGIDIKVKPKREKIIKHKADNEEAVGENKANRKRKDKVDDSSHQTNKKHIIRGDVENPQMEIKGTKTIKLQKRPENCPQEPKKDRPNDNYELCDKCGKHRHTSKKPNLELEMERNIPKMKDNEAGKKEKGENDVDTKIQKKHKPVRKAKSLKAVAFGKPPLKPTKSERQSDKKNPDLCDHCGKQIRKQKTKYSRIDQREEDIAFAGEAEARLIHNSKALTKKKTKGDKRKQSPNDNTMCKHCEDKLTAEQLNITNQNSKGTELTEYNVNLKTDDLEHHNGVPCRQCHPSSAIIRKRSKKDGKKAIAEKSSLKKAKSKILDTDPKKVISDLKEKIGPLFDNCSGSVDKCVKKLTTIPAVRKFRDAVKCVREIINKDYTERDKSKPVTNLEGATINQTEEKEAEKAVLELRIDQGGMCILNSSDIQTMMRDAQAKFHKSQKEKNKPDSRKKKSEKKPKKIKKEKKLQTQKEQGDDEEYLRKGHKCNICCECQRANRERYKNILCRKKRLNKHLVCCEEPNPQGTWDDEPEQDDLMFKPDFSVYVDTYSKSIVNDLDFRQNTAGTGCPICDADHAKQNSQFPIPPVEILIDKKSLSITNLPKARLKMREAVNNMQKLKATRRKEKMKTAIDCTCSSTCKEGLTKKKPKPKKVQKIQKKTSPCPCGDVCKGPRPGVKLNEGKKKSDKKKGKGKGKGKEKGKDKDKGKKDNKEKAKILEQRAKERQKIKLHKKLQNEKKNKIKKKIEMIHRQQVQAKYKKEDAKRRRARLKSDKKAMKNIKKVDNDFALVADSVFDILTLGSRTVAGSARCAERELLDLKGTVEKIKKFKHNPQLAVQQMQSTFSDSPVQSTCQRIRYRCARMKCTQAFISKMEECACTNYLIHSCDKDPKKRLKHKKRKEKRERVPLDFECSLYMGQLRKKTWLCIYYMCPWFYPHWRAIVEGFKQFTDMLLFLLAVLVWSPCIAAFELFRTFICCVVCTK